MRIELEHPLRFADRDLGEQFGGACQRLRAATAPDDAAASRSAICAPTRLTGLSDGHRVLRDQRDAAAEQASPLAVPACASRSRPSNWMVPRSMTALRRQRCRARPVRASTCRRRIRRPVPSPRRRPTPGWRRAARWPPRTRPIVTCRSVHRENGRHRRCTGSKRALRPSPNRLNPITLKMTQPIAQRHDPRRLIDDLAALGDHAAPGRDVAGDRNADKGQDHLDQDRDPHLDARAA